MPAPSGSIQYTPSPMDVPAIRMSRHDVPGFWIEDPSGTQPVEVQTLFDGHIASSGTRRQRSPLSSQRSTVHATPSPQLGGAPATQPPLTHVSVPVQKRPSLH